jgi:hypothetical protein
MAAALQKDHAALTARLAKTDALFVQIGGKLTDEQARTLILTKNSTTSPATNSTATSTPPNAAKRQLIQLLENLWDKYAVSSRTLETERTAALKALDGFHRIGVSEMSAEPFDSLSPVEVGSGSDLSSLALLAPNAIHGNNARSYCCEIELATITATLATANAPFTP